MCYQITIGVGSGNGWKCHCGCLRGNDNGRWGFTCGISAPSAIGTAITELARTRHARNPRINYHPPPKLSGHKKYLDLHSTFEIILVTGATHLFVAH